MLEFLCHLILVKPQKQTESINYCGELNQLRVTMSTCYILRLQSLLNWLYTFAKQCSLIHPSLPFLQYHMTSESCTHATSPSELNKFGKGIFTVGKNVTVVDKCSICFDMLHLDTFPPPLKQRETVLFSLQEWKPAPNICSLWQNSCFLPFGLLLVLLRCWVFNDHS